MPSWEDQPRWLAMPFIAFKTVSSFASVCALFSSTAASLGKQELRGMEAGARIRKTKDVSICPTCLGSPLPR